MEAKQLCKDRISSLPSILIEDILCRVPIRDAVRTSILSRNWRYNWATIPKLVFNENDMFDKSNNMRQPEKRILKAFNAIQKVLLLHHGPILEFTLYMTADKRFAEIDQIILHLSRRNTVEKLTLDLEDYIWSSVYPYRRYRLPLSIFSFHQLKDLSLCNCEFELINPTFSGFTLSSLTSLSLMAIRVTSIEPIIHFVSRCPLLKHFHLISGNPEVGEYGFILESFELFKCLPVIEHLSINAWTIECFAPQDLPTLVHLKSLSMDWMVFVYEFRLSALFQLIRCSPNLEKIEITQEDISEDNIDLTVLERNSLDDYTDIWLKHLLELEIEFIDSKLELEFVKLILAKSPMLKKVRI